MPLVIIDGPEAAGKSTLINSLSEAWGEENLYRHWGPRKSWLEYCGPLFEDLTLCASNPQCLVVWSRSWLSRVVYNKLLDQGQRIPSTVISELDNIVVASGGLLILVTAPVRVLVERRNERLLDATAKPDHPLDPQREMSEFQAQTSRRKWKVLSGIDPPEDNVRTIMTLLVQRNPECRMDLRKEEPIAVGYGVSPWTPEE